MDLTYFSGVFDSLYLVIRSFLSSDYFAFIAVTILLIFLINSFMELFRC